MKTLFLSHAGHWTGAEQCLYQLVKGLHSERFAPLVLLPHAGELQDRLNAIGIPNRIAKLVHWVGTPDRRRLPRFVEDLEPRVAAVAEIIEREGIDLVFSNSAVIVEGGLAAKRCGVPHVWRIHEMLADHTNFAPLFSLGTYGRLLSTLADSIAVVSNSVKEALCRLVWADGSRVPSERIDVIYNGIEVWPHRKPDKCETFGFNGPLALYVGSLSREKGVHLLAEAMALVKAQVPDAQCALVGHDAGAQAHLLEQGFRAGIDDAFHFLGFRKNPIELIAACDLLVLPSFVDSLPGVVMEAMAAATPVVATRSGGAAEMVVDGETGHLVPVGDVRAMADAIGSVLGDPERARRMGQRGQERVRQLFAYSKYIADFEALFDRLVRSERSPSSSGWAELAAGLREGVGATADGPSATG